MKQFEFIADKEKNILTMRREFAAPRAVIWDYYTKAEYLEQWFAPIPFTTKTKSMDFRDGGHWHYAMVEPDGKEYWGYTEYLTIHPIDNYVALDAFCDENGEINKELPRAKWFVIFTDKGANTIVESVLSFNSLSDLETVINMGMEEGVAATYEKLDELLAKA